MWGPVAESPAAAPGVENAALAALPRQTAVPGRATEPGSTITDPGSTQTIPDSAVTDPGGIQTAPARALGQAVPGASEAYRSYALHHDVAVTAEALQSAGLSLAQAYIYADALVSDAMSLPLTDLQKSNLASLHADPIAQATWSRLRPTPAEPISATQTASPGTTIPVGASSMTKEGNVGQKLLAPTQRTVASGGGVGENHIVTTAKQKEKTKGRLDYFEKEGTIVLSRNRGAHTDVDDPLGVKRDAIAADYYEQIRNRDRKYEIRAVAKNSGFSIEDIDMVFAHIFELEHLFEDGEIHRFFPDYYMQHSWMRLRSGKNIQEHDRILLYHELEEAKIMGTGTDVVYEHAHREVEKIYNYKEALLKYLKDNEA